MVNRIIDLKIDDRLMADAPELVDEVVTVRFRDTSRYLLSFASKYCAWHNPTAYQIYDSYVDWILWEYQKRHRFCEFCRYELRDYSRFIQIVKAFQSFFKLDKMRRKDVDKFLWIEANLA